MAYCMPMDLQMHKRRQQRRKIGKLILNPFNPGSNGCVLPGLKKSTKGRQGYTAELIDVLHEHPTKYILA